MILEHYADTEITLDRDRTYTQPSPRTYSKPRGFWVSVKGEDDWPSWCRNEGFAPHRLSVRHSVVLSSTENILQLTSIEALDAFTRTYGLAERKSYGSHSWTDMAIDWSCVAGEYDGVLIAPYQWGRRMGLDWYYGWDVASGCIWNLSAIKSVSAEEFAMVEAAQ